MQGSLKRRTNVLHLVRFRGREAVILWHYAQQLQLFLLLGFKAIVRVNFKTATSDTRTFYVDSVTLEYSSFIFLTSMFTLNNTNRRKLNINFVYKLRAGKNEDQLIVLFLASQALRGIRVIKNILENNYLHYIQIQEFNPP